MTRGNCTDDDAGNGRYFATIAELFASWKAWTEAAGEFTGSQKRLSQKLEARGFQRDRRGGARDRGFYGIALRP